MVRQCVCPKGHQWEAADEDNSATCPICGETSVGETVDQSRTTADASPPQPGPTTSGSGTRQPDIPGYEDLELLGRGGMAVVYRARHERLKRTVAIKMILAGTHATEKSLARFQTEAEAVAKLQHPNIVQIFEVGEHDGLRFLALEYVDGGSLRDQLDGSPWAPDKAAHLVEKLADAVHTAHEAGVVHRDLKPGNVLVTQRGVAKVADFGLARMVDQPGTEYWTQTGDILGTPCYMAPEQASDSAGETGFAADIYSLGAILYELLTGRPPFRAATVLDTLDQVRHREPVRPSQLVARLPRDLETICLKCLRKEPYKRYRTARALADDLRCFLEGRPIQARPVGSLQRAARWCRRQPAIAALTAVAVLSVSAGTLAAVYFAVAEKHRADELVVAKRRADRLAEEAGHAAETARRQEQQKEEERARAERNLTRARAAIEEMLIAVGQEELAYVPQMEPVRRQLLAKAKSLYDELLAESANDPSVRFEAARARRLLADIERQVGQFAESEASLADANTLLDQLEREHPETAAYRYESALVAARRAALLAGTERVEEGEALYRNALQMYRQQPPSVQDAPDAVIEWAHAAGRLATLLAARGEVREAEQLFLHAESLFQQVLKAFADNARAKLGLAVTQGSLGKLYASAPQPAKARQMFELAAAQLEALLAISADAPPVQSAMADVQSDLGMLAANLGHWDTAVPYLEDARRRWDELAAAYPTTPAFQESLARSSMALGRAYAESNRNSEAERELRAALAAAEDLAAASATPQGPKTIPARLELTAGIELQLGRLLFGTTRTDEAEQHLRRAQETYENLSTQFPDIAMALRGLADSCLELGRVFQAQKRLPEAEAAYRQAAADYVRCAAQNPRDSFLVYTLALCHFNIGSLIVETRPEDAEPEFRQALHGLQQVLLVFFSSPDFQLQLATVQGDLAELLLRKNQLDEAEKLIARALDMAPALEKNAPQSQVVRETLHQLRRRSVRLQGLRRDWPALLAACQDLAAGGPSNGLSHYEAAVLLIGALPLVANDDRLTDEQRTQRADELRQSALEHLRAARSQGVGADKLQSDEALAPLRDAPTFQELLKGER